MLAPRMSTVSREPTPTHHQSTITEILPPHYADNTQHHIRFISSSVGTMIRVVYSSFFGVETAKPTTMVVPPPNMQTHPIYTLPTSLGSTESTTKSLSCSSLSTKKMNLFPHYLTQPSSTLDNIFLSEEDILEAMKELECPWDSIHHRSFFLPEKVFVPLDAPTHDVCTIESKDFPPSGHVDWFKNPIPTLDTFEEGNMSSISPTTKVDISMKLGTVEEISLGAACFPNKVTSYKSLFQECRDIFTQTYTEMPYFNPTITEHHISTWPDAHPI